MNAGTLEIQIVAEIARLQEDMRKVQKSVGDMSTGVAKSAKAANDNLASIGVGASAGLKQYARDVSALKAQLDPAWAAAQRFSQAQKLGMDAMRQGAITREQLIAHMRTINAEYKNAIAPLNRVTAASGAAKAGMQQLGMQIGDAATMFSLGAKPAQIFASQIGQVTQAIQLMAGGTSRLATFLGGPWGIAISTATILLTPFIAKLFETEDAANAAKDALEGLRKERTQQLSQENLLSDAMAKRGALQRQEADLIAEIARRSGGRKQADGTPMFAHAQFQRLQALRAELNELHKDIDFQFRKNLPSIADALKTTEKERAPRIRAAGKSDAEKYAEGFREAIAQVAEDVRGLLGLAAQAGIGGSALFGEGSLEDETIRQVRDFSREANKASDERTTNMRLEMDAAAALQEQYAALASVLGQLGGVGSVLGDALGLLSGNATGMGGPLGQLLNMQIGTSAGANGETIAKTLGDELSSIFKINGDFTKAMASVLQGGGIGIAAGQALFGNQSTTQQIGSALGGVAGKALGDVAGKAIGGTLGKAMGPLGSVLGGVLGSVVGGLFKKTKWGSATLSASGISATAGNSNSSERAALSAGNNIFGALGDIADQFGGSVGDFGNITVGVRHGDYRVNTGGTSLKKKKGAVDFDQDAEAAIAYALQEAINRGAITGIRAATSNLLKSSDDLQANLEKALKFEGVFSELKSMTDPFGFAMDQLQKEFDRLRVIFEEAGASAAEYGELEQLLALKRQEIIDDQRAEAISKLSDQNGLEVEFLRLLGREQDALALARLNELSSTKAALQPMQAMIYQLQDARAVIEQFGPLADGLKAFKAELLGGSASGGFAYLMGQFRSTASAAAGGDAGAMGRLQQDASAYLDAAKANASSELEYRRAVGEVLAATDQGIFAAEAQVDYAQLQIDAIAANTNILADLKSELATYQQQLVEQGEWVQRQFRRWDSDGIRIQNDADTPIYTEAA